MRVRIIGHQDKGCALADALRAGGVKVSVDCPQILLMDADQNEKQVLMIKAAVESRIKVGLYSHGAPVVLIWDGVFRPDPRISFYLAQSQGQKDVMLAYGYPHPIYPIGWHYCRQKPFAPVEEVKSVLFAAWHPDSRGLAWEAFIANNVIQDKLRRLPYSLTVRYIGKLPHNGIDKRIGVKYQLANYTLASSIEAIDGADLIVANCSTFATLAIARGKPVIMYGQDIHSRPDGEDGEIEYRHWNAYKEMLRYRYDIEQGNLEDVIYEATHYEDSEWRERFIGEQMQPLELVKTLNRLKR